MKVCFGVISLTLAIQVSVRLTRPKHRFNKNEGKGRYLTMNEKINLNPRITSVFDSKRMIRKCVLNDRIKDTYITDGFMFIKKGFNKSLDGKIENLTNVLDAKMKIEIEDILEIDARIKHTILKSCKNTIYMNSKYYVYFENLTKKGFTLKLSNMDNLPILLLMKNDEILIGALGLRISVDFMETFEKEQTLKEYKKEIEGKKDNNKKIMDEIFNKFTTNILNEEKRIDIIKENFEKAGLSKKDFYLKKDGIFVNVKAGKKILNDIPLFNERIAYQFTKDNKLVDKIYAPWSDMTTNEKKYLYKKVLDFFF